MIRSVMLIVIPLLLAFGAVVLKKLSGKLLIAGVLANAVMVFLVERGDDFLGGYLPPYGIVLHVADYGYYGLLVVNIAFALLVLLVFSKLKELGPVMLITLASLNGLLMTGDLFNLFVFIEIASISSFIIASRNRKFADVFNYMVVAILGSISYLLGIVLLYSRYGTLNMTRLHQLMVENPLESYIPVILIFAGLAVEVKLAPFNGWVKNILGNSDEVTGALLGSIYSGVMLMVFGRMFADIMVLGDRLVWILSIVAIFTLLSGEAAAFDSGKIREVLLYSSVAQSGLGAVLFLNGYTSIAIMSIFGNVVAKFIMYFIAGRIVDETGTDSIEELKGSFRRNVIEGAAFTIAAMSVMGLPLFYGFIVKISALYSIFMSGGYLLPVIILSASLVEGVYMVRLVVGLWNKGSFSNEDRTSKYSSGAIAGLSILALSLVLVFLGIMPGGLVEAAGDAGKDLSGSRYIYRLDMNGGIK